MAVITIAAPQAQASGPPCRCGAVGAAAWGRDGKRGIDAIGRDDLSRIALIEGRTRLGTTRG